MDIMSMTAVEIGKKIRSKEISVAEAEMCIRDSLGAGKCNRSHPDPDPCGGRNLADDEELDDQRRTGSYGHRRERDFL